MSSILSRNIAKLGTKFLDGIRYIDIDYRGFINEFADPTVELGDALVNDLKLWIQSSQGDYYRRPTMGGFFDTIRKYPLTSAGADQLASDLKGAITKNFTSITIIELNIIPDIANRGWRLRMAIKDTITGIMTPLTTTIETE